MTLEETRRKLRNGLEQAYVNGEIGMGKERDRNYEEAIYRLRAARRLEEIGDVDGARVTLRRIAKGLPNVKLITPNR